MIVKFMKKTVLGMGVVALLRLVPPSGADGLEAASPPVPVTPAVLLFEPALFEVPSSVAFPDWIAGVGQAGGEVGGVTSSWHVAESAPVGTGRLWIELNRQVLNENLALSLVSEPQTASDMIIQLLDGQGQVVVLDLFGNIHSAAAESRTDTFVIPLLKYPTVTRIVLRRVSGEAALNGAALIPVVLEKDVGTNLVQVLQFARLLGDRLSPENELVRRVRCITGAETTVVKQGQSTISKGIAPARKAPQGLNEAAAPKSNGRMQGDSRPETVSFGNIDWSPWRILFEVQGDKLVSLPAVRPGFRYGHGGNGRGAEVITNIGNEQWKDYSVELEFCMSGVDPKLNPHGLPLDYRGGAISFHIADAAESWNECGVSSYYLSLAADGSWGLGCIYNQYCRVPSGYGDARNDGARQLASGKGMKLDPKNGNRFRIDVRGTRIQIWVDGESIVDVRDEKMRDPIGGKTLDHGGVGVGGYHDCMIWIRNFSVKHL